MRRLALLIAGGAIWLFLAAIPALADGGPHVSTINNGSLGIDADSCAGCHRAHTAAGPFLINAADEEALCFTCHGAGGTGSTVDVATGLQYTLGTGDDVRGTTVLGALRNGGFIKAAIDSSNASRSSYLRNDVDVSQHPRVGVLAAPEAVTSAHLTIADDPSTPAQDGNGLTMPGIVWGNGAFGDTSVGPATVDLTCASCHNPHGNGQYRILNPIPHLEDADFAAVEPGPTSTITQTRANAAQSSSRRNRIMTGTLPDGPGHGFVPGDTVTITGTTFNGTYVVESVGVDSSSGTTYTGSGLAYFRVYATGSSLPLLAPGTATGLTGSVVRSTSATVATLGIHVTDAALPGTGDTRNYTVIQNPLQDNAVQTGRTLFASQVIGAGYGPTDGDYFRRGVPWAPEVIDPATCDPTQPPTTACSNAVPTNNDAPNGLASFNEQITAWCSTCHSRYYADGTIPVLGSAYETDSGDPTFAYRHSTRSNRTCNVCHVAHGSNATMDGDYSSTYTYPDKTTESDSSRLLKIDNRGTCQACHDPTGTIAAGAYLGPVVGVP